ncbi:hypothetical protein GPECTOR_427g295 [Gonium pectorale]|uniref:Uncharacterized protein n=1 Tax=Gonium pectorale TaxID=33097 RepID=A0A150FV53_GONPE|nr:hypothetical protein GPECTOR_427g295 [Gonium pectorale]|eukprot:KXZ41501.1 hypothetical protein GPECTOR_427g295 [Gonium pectorale]
MTHMSEKQKEQIAQEKFGRHYDELDTDEKKAVGGQFRANELGHEGYSDMGKKGGKKGGYSTGYAHDPEEQKKHTDRTGNETAME